MKKLLIVTSSVREGRVADVVMEFTKAQLADKDFEVSVADLKELPMPFFNSPQTPSDESYKPTDETVIKWSKMVSEADAVLLLVAEYNHSMTAVLKNAIDWLYKEWNEKPVGFVGYGWVGGARAIAALRLVFSSSLAAKMTESEANLRFTKEIDTEGHIIDEVTSKEAVDKVIKGLEKKTD